MILLRMTGKSAWLWVLGAVGPDMDEEAEQHKNAQEGLRNQQDRRHEAVRFHRDERRRFVPHATTLALSVRCGYSTIRTGGGSLSL